MKKSLAGIFNRFTGREIPVHEVYNEATGETLSVKVLDHDEPVIKEMQKAAAENGLHLRVCFTGMDDTTGYQSNRVNVYVDKVSIGAWRVSNRFDLG